MSEKVRLKGCICEVNFGYDDMVEGYANVSSDISKLAEVCPRTIDHMRGCHEDH
jgi:hypothetical protein